MNIILNNTPDSLEGDKISISELLAAKKYTFKMLVIKVNEHIVKKEDYSSTFIYDGDNVVVLHLMSGG
jgi:thiamine biosynthesis protein ThiS